jgi:hypothetical protein
MWTRADEIHNGYFRPISAHYLRATIPANWEHGIKASAAIAACRLKIRSAP